MLELPIRSSTRFRNKNGMRLLVGRASIWPFAPLLNTKSPETWSIEVKVKYSPPLGQSWAAGPVTGLRRLCGMVSGVKFHGMGQVIHHIPWESCRWAVLLHGMFPPKNPIHGLN
jgi:hypothetical protein